MDMEKLTERARGFVQAAQTIAIREQNQQLETQHLLKALLDDREGLAAGLLTAAGANARQAADDVENLGDNDLREPHARLVQQQHLGCGHPGAPDGQHLLLTTLQAPSRQASLLAAYRDKRISAI